MNALEEPGWSETCSSLHCFLFWSRSGSVPWGRKTSTGNLLPVSAVGAGTPIQHLHLPGPGTFSFAQAFGMLQMFLLWMQTLFLTLTLTLVLTLTLTFTLTPTLTLTLHLGGTCCAAAKVSLLRYPYAIHNGRRKLWRGKKRDFPQPGQKCGVCKYNSWALLIVHLTSPSNVPYS